MNDKINSRDNLILIVDDSETIRKGLSGILKENGYTCVTASDGLDAVEQFKNGLDVDLVLVDIEMPKMDGIETCKKIREEYNDRYIPIIMLTAHDSQTEVLKGFDAGADDYISKKAQQEEFLARVRSNVRARNYFLEMQDAQRKLKEMGMTIASMQTVSQLNDSVGKKLRNIKNIVNERDCDEAVDIEIKSIYQIMNTLLDKHSEEYSRYVQDIGGGV